MFNGGLANPTSGETQQPAKRSIRRNAAAGETRFDDSLNSSENRCSDEFESRTVAAFLDFIRKSEERRSSLDWSRFAASRFFPPNPPEIAIRLERLRAGSLILT